MRSCFVILAVVVGAASGAACGARARQQPIPARPVVEIPADDLLAAKPATPRAGARLTTKDPRVIDLDIVQVRAGEGGDDAVLASRDLFREANDAAKAGQARDAIARFRQLVSVFPTSAYAPVSLFNIAALYDQQGDAPATIAALRELVDAYPASRESIEGHLYIAALEADRAQWAAATATLDAVLARANLTATDRVEAHARRGYVLLEQRRLDDADAALAAAIAEWRRAPRLDDPYYIAMAHYYRGALAHRRFADAPVRLPDDQLIADLEAKRVLAGAAYDRWKESLAFKHAYWATASGYQMSQIFYELWEATVTAPYPVGLDPAQRPRYVAEVHDRVRDYLTKALEGHRMNVELAKAYGVDTEWSEGSARQIPKLAEALARDVPGTFVTPAR